jgi:hypothetical protein
MRTLAVTATIGGIGLLLSSLVLLMPSRQRQPPLESFEDSQKRLRRHLSEMRRDEHGQ